MTNKTCPKCGKEVIEKQSQKTGKTYDVNPDTSYHSIPVNQPDGKTNWYCSSSKQHQEWIKTHNGPSGFVEPSGTTGTYNPVSGELEAVLPSKEENKDLDESERIVIQAFTRASQMVKNIYPNLKQDSNTFGQIRSKFADQLLGVYNTQKIVAELDSKV